MPPYRFAFPQDHASHNDFKTEWWYYTGHLTADDGSNFGYELTFFRSGLDSKKGVSKGPWQLDNVYMAHFAVSNLSARKFFYAQKLNRAGLQFAGAKQDSYSVFNQNWTARLVGDEHLVRATTPEYSVDLKMKSLKPPVIHGINGVSQKAECEGCASHYYSLTRLQTSGTVTTPDGKTHKVSGLTWMDHEFGSNQLTKEQVGWDWFSLQLDNDTDLMLYVMRRRDGTFDPNSSGTFVSTKGTSDHLKLSDYKLRSLGTWKSPVTKAEYPSGWHASIPSRKVELDIIPQLADQELAKRSSTDVTYWEGACRVSGTMNGAKVSGQAYVELTGYGEAFSKNI